MKVYKTQDIRNVAILGHGGCGKTTLVEAMAYAAGVTKRQGKVDVVIHSVIMIKKKFAENFQSARQSFLLNGNIGRSIY